MTQQEVHLSQEQLTIRLKPIVSYPREAKVGERYLFTIDVQLAEDSPWPYQEEEFEISFILETDPFFIHEPVGEHEPGIVLHRYGGTYGAAEYLLTASPKTVASGKIKVTLLNGWGLAIAQLELECEVKKDAQSEAKWTTRTTNQEQQTARSPEHPEVEQREDAILDDHQQQELIAKQLTMVGWEIWSVDMLATLGPNGLLQVPRGFIALHGYPSVEDDYLLIIDRVIVGIVKVYVGEEQLPDKVEDIALPDFIVGRSNLKFEDSILVVTEIKNEIPFVYHTTGYTTIFSSYLELAHYLRNVYTFHQPSTFGSRLNELRNLSLRIFRALLSMLPELKQHDLFDYQYEALQLVDQSLSGGYSRTLIQLETGRGKTYTATRYVYRLLEDAEARHLFYVVDVPVAKDYALDVFRTFIVPEEEQQRFIDLYRVELIGNEKLDPSVHVYIGTLEDLYRLYSSGEEGNCLPQLGSRDVSLSNGLKDYCADLPIEYFDAIILAESEHIDYQFWRPVLDYFDTFYIGIASSISDEVLRFFNTHLVYPLRASTNAIQYEQVPTSSTTKPKQSINLIKRVRNLLHNDIGLYGDDDILTQIVWLLLLKYLDDFELAQEELMRSDYAPIISKNYRWRDWATVEHWRDDEELLTFVNRDLIPYLAQLGGSTNRDLGNIIGTVFRETHNRIRSGSILREVVDNINNINFNSSVFRTTSVFYEALLKELLTSKTTAGEFYTPRPLIKFIIDRLQPQLGESLLDPACGTAGFLTEAYEQLIVLVHTPEQRQQLQDHLIGIEKKPIAYLLGVMNMLLHGIEVPNIIQSNALVTNIQQLRDEDYVDIIATSPPFGGEEERSIINNFPDGLRTAETALLFVQYIMQALKRPGGRCGIVLPDGFLFGNGIASKIKHRLLTNFDLHTIVRLPRGAFAPYTNIPTNILFFEASEYLNSTGRESLTQEVWYYEIPLPKGWNSYTKTRRPIQYEAFHDCLLWWEHREENDHAWKVPVEDLFANDCNLDVKNPHKNDG